MPSKFTLIGFGEAGSTFARAASWGGLVSAWDIDPERRDEVPTYSLASSPSAKSALENAKMVLSLVTADQALEAAQKYACFLEKDAIWCDMNSVAPETKRAAAMAVEAAGAHYVDVAVLAPVEPARLSVPLLISGQSASAAQAKLEEAGFTNVRVVGEEVGKASTIKMIRSVMVKGIEALTDEMMQAAEAAGVTKEVLSSLDASEKSISWFHRSTYNQDRMAVHGERRAAEMEESAKTLISLGVAPVMTSGTIERQRSAAKGKCS